MHEAIEDARHTVPATLRKLRDYYGYTDVEMAAMTGIPRTTVRSRMTKNAQAATSVELAGFAKVFGVPVGVLFLTPNEALRWVIDHAPQEANRAKPGRRNHPASGALLTPKTATTARAA